MLQAMSGGVATVPASNKQIGYWSLCGIPLSEHENAVIRWHGSTRTFGASYSSGRLDDPNRLEGHYIGKPGDSPRDCIAKAKEAARYVNMPPRKVAR